MKKILFRRPNIDSCLTAVVLAGWEKQVQDWTLPVVAAARRATKEELESRDILCLDLGTINHVSEDEDFFLRNLRRRALGDPSLAETVMMPMSAQLYEYIHKTDASWNWPLFQEGLDMASMEPFYRMCLYVHELAVAGTRRQYTSQGMGLTGVFSGMMSLYNDSPVRQFISGCSIMYQALRKIDPFESVPMRGTKEEITEWTPYIESRIETRNERGKVSRCISYHRTNGGKRVGFVNTSYMAATGAVYSQGCNIAVIVNPQRFITGEDGQPKSIRKVIISTNDATIAANDIPRLVRLLNELEPGWGMSKEGYVLGSSQDDSCELGVETVLNLIKKEL